MPDVSFVGLLIVAIVAFLAPLLLGLSPARRLPSVVVEIVVGIIILAVIPSFWLYFANSVLHWDASFWLSKARDAIAAGWITTWFAIFFLLGYLLQEQRKRLRGTGGGTRPAGGYR